jgi:hypothetical protein
MYSRRQQVSGGVERAGPAPTIATRNGASAVPGIKYQLGGAEVIRRLAVGGFVALARGVLVHRSRQQGTACWRAERVQHLAVDGLYNRDPQPRTQLQGYGELETGCRSPSSKRANRKGRSSDEWPPRSTCATSRPTAIILYPWFESAMTNTFGRW